MMFGKKKVKIEEVDMNTFFENETEEKSEDVKTEEKSEKKGNLLRKVAGIGLLTVGIGGAILKTIAKNADDSEDSDDTEDDSEVEDDDDDSEDDDDDSED